MININYAAKNVNIIIVGSESSIGSALKGMLLDAGATVYGIDIKKGSEVEIIDNYHYYESDPLEPSKLSEISLKLASISINGLVCLSGTIKHFGTVLDLDESQWQEVYNISFRSCYNACKAFAPLLQKCDRASIVNMSSGLAFGGQANYGPYTNAKASINSLSKTLATELAPSIRVNTVAPGAVDTGFIYDNEGKMRFDKARYLQIVPLKSLATSEEISHLILFLLSNAASHITGQCIHINGGAMMV